MQNVTWDWHFFNWVALTALVAGFFYTTGSILAAKLFSK
jgi:hypothetical protein